jgi:TPR repeat protein
MKKSLLVMLFIIISYVSAWSDNFNYIKKLAEQGNVEAQNRLGFMYSEGNDVPQDYKKALYWYTKAAEQGNVEAQGYVGFIYHQGQWVPQDYIQALHWFTKAAEQGSIDAQSILAFMYYQGQGVPQDYKQALYWFTKAAEQGDEEAKRLRTELTNKLSAKQLSEAQDISAKTQAQIYLSSTSPESSVTMAEAVNSTIGSDNYAESGLMFLNGFYYDCNPKWRYRVESYNSELFIVTEKLGAWRLDEDLSSIFTLGDEGRYYLNKNTSTPNIITDKNVTFYITNQKIINSISGPAKKNIEKKVDSNVSRPAAKKQNKNVN